METKDAMPIAVNFRCLGSLILSNLNNLRLLKWDRIKHCVNQNVPFPTIDQEGIHIQRFLSVPGQAQMLTTTG